MTKELNLKWNQKITVNLDQFQSWEFNYNNKIYKLNIKEILRLLKLIKGDKLI